VLILKKILATLATIIFGLILALFILELGLWLVPDAIWKGQVSKNPTRYRLFQTDKNIGWTHVPNAQSNWEGYGEYNVDITINSLGLRDYEHTYAKPPGTFRILILGDSFTEGMQVDLAQTFPPQLQTCLAGRVSRPVEVINAGNSSYGPGEELLFFTHEGVKYQPDLVVTAIFPGNDLKDIKREPDSNMVQSFGGYQFYLDDGRLEKRWIEWADPPDEKISWLQQFLRRYSGLYYTFQSPDSQVLRDLDRLVEPWWPDLLSSGPPVEISQPADFPDYAYEENLIVFTKNFPDNPLVPPSVHELWQLFKAILQQLQAETEAHGAQLAVVLIPREAQVHPELYNERVIEYAKRYDLLQAGLDVWDISAPNHAIADLMLERGIPTLDLMPGFQAYAQTNDGLLYFEKDIHLNEKGHQLAANLICDWLVEQELIPLQ
jgi:lysophospholipase L1-like esterase